MKTSTKLLIVLFACIPVSMVAYGYLLKQQFDAGNFVQNVYTYHSKYTEKTLPAFKHVIIKGDLDITGDSPLTFTSSKKGVGYSTLSGYEDMVKAKIKGDTLYISFVSLKEKNMSELDQNVCFLYLNNSDLQSAELNIGNYRLKTLAGENLSIDLRNAGLNVENIVYKDFKISADNAKWINIDSSRIGLLQYSLANKSPLNLTNNDIEKFLQLSADSLSKISVQVQGYAIDMEKFLPKLSKPIK